MSRLIFRALPLVLTMIAHPATAAFTPLGRMFHSTLLLGNTIYLHGGDDSSGNVVSSLYSLDVSQSWLSESPLWADHSSDAGTFSVPGSAFKPMWPSADGKSFYIWGGSSDTGQLPQNGFAQYVVATKSWSVPSSISNMPQQRSDVYVGVASTGVAYFWGGWGSYYTGYFATDKTAKHIFDGVFTFDTNKLAWNVVQVTGTAPVPTLAHTITMLPNDQMVIIGGLTGVQSNDTNVKQIYAPMSDIPVFDTKTSTWTLRTAAGNLPSTRRYHSAVLGMDGVSIIISCGGSNTAASNFNDVAVLNTTSWLWTQPSVAGVAPAGRLGPSSVMVNGQMVITFGRDNALNLLNDVAVLDTRSTPFQWTNNFTASSSSSSSSGLAAIGGIGGVIGICVAVLVIAALIIFLVIRKPWRKANAPKETHEVPPNNQYNANPNPNPNSNPNPNPNPYGHQYNVHNAEPNRPPFDAHQIQMTNPYNPHVNTGLPADQYNLYAGAGPSPHTHQTQPNNPYYAMPYQPPTNQYNPYSEPYGPPPPMYPAQSNSQQNPYTKEPPMPVQQHVDNSQPATKIMFIKPDDAPSSSHIVFSKPDVQD